MSSAIEKAPRAVIARINGDPPGVTQYLSTEDLHSLQNFDLQLREGRGNYFFANTDELGLPKRPKSGRKINPDPGYTLRTGKIGFAVGEHELPMRIRKRMRDDPQVALGLAAIKAPIMAAFEAIRVDCTDPVIKGFVHHVLMKENGGILRRAVYSALKSLDFGFVAHEKVWKNGVDVEFSVDSPDGTTTLQRMTNCTLLEELSDLDPELTDIQVYTKTSEYAGIRYSWDQELRAEDSWLITHDKEFGNLRGKAVLDRIYNPWYWCDIMYLFTNRYFERKANPPIKGRAPTSLTDDQGTVVPGATVFARMLETLVSEGIIVLPSETSGEGRSEKHLWDVEFMMDDKRGEMFQRYIEHLQTLKLRGILIPEMVVERGAASAGTFGMARAHTDTFVGMLTLVLEGLREHINRYLIPEIILHNFPGPTPPCSIDTLVKIGERKDMLEQLIMEIIGAESRVGSLDTARMIDIIQLMRQSNINVADQRRKQPDFDENVSQKRMVAESQKAIGEAQQSQADSAAESVGIDQQRADTEKKRAETEAKRPQPKPAAPKPATRKMDVETPEQEERIARLESKLEKLFAHFGIKDDEVV